MVQSSTRITRAMVDRRPKPKLQVDPSPSITTQYFRDLNRLVRKVMRLAKELIFPVLDKYESRYAMAPQATRGFQDDDFGLELENAFRGLESQLEGLDRMAERIATDRLSQANKEHRRKFVKAWNEEYGVNVSKQLAEPVVIYGRLKDADTVVPIKQAIRRNVDLIKTIPKQNLAQIRKAIEEGIKNGDDSYSLKKVIKELEGKNKNRAKLIARDQLQKLNSNLNQARQQTLGIRGYIWRTSNDERVRQSHKDNNGKRFQWDKPPSGTGHPGDDIQCRCVAEPDLGELIPSLNPDLQKLGPKRRNRITI